MALHHAAEKLQKQYFHSKLGKLSPGSTNRRSHNSASGAKNPGKNHCETVLIISRSDFAKCR